MTPTRLALLVRILIALSTRTFFQPDEYFQSIEPAHHAVFGYGHLTWEWLVPRPIRSIAYPALNVPIFWALKVLRLSELPVLGDLLLIHGPKLLHGAFAAATDIWLLEVARQWLGSQYVQITLLLSLTSLFHALSLSRSLSNSLETSLTTIAFAYYPWDASSKLSPNLLYNRSRLLRTLVFSALACIVRPTNAVIWMFLYGNLFWALRFKRSMASTLILQVSAVGIIALLSLLILDSLYYKKLIFTPLNFLLTNLSAVSLFYGSNSWHYYLTQALPILCTTALPFVLHGVWLVVFDQKATALRTMLATVTWYIGIFSLAGHKEWRFIHPILPLLHVFATKSLIHISDIYAYKKKKTRHSSFFQRISGHLPPIPTKFLLLLLLNIPASLFAILVYCRAPISVMSYLRALPQDELGKGVGFLMPCHSTPGSVYLHRQGIAEGQVWALSCEPPLGQDSSTYHDQTEIFFQSPKRYLEIYFPPQVDTLFPPSHFPTPIPGSGNAQPSISDDGSVKYPWMHEWPKRLVLFGALLLEDGVKWSLQEKGYREVWNKGWGWEGEGHRTGGVRVWQWGPHDVIPTRLPSL